MKCYENNLGLFYSHFFIFFVNTNRLISYYIALDWKRLAKDKHSSLVSPLISYKENEEVL